jgi:hypothetical protein
MEGVENVKITQSQRAQSFYVRVAFLCFIILVLGVLSGFLYFKYVSCKNDNNCKDKSEIEAIAAVTPSLLGLATSGGLMFLIKLYFGGIENQLKEDAEKRKNQLDLETVQERHRLEREVPSEYRYPIEMDFLSVYYEKTEDVPDISYEGFCSQIKGSCDSRGGIKEKTENYISQCHPETIKEVLEGLDKGFSKDEDGTIPFYQLAKHACNHALKLDHGKFEQWAKPFYDDIILYLNAWLVCSVKYGFAIPIRPFVLPLKKLGEEVAKLDDGRPTSRYLGEEAIGHYFEEDSYIEAIQYIQNEMLKGYLGKLVDLLKDEKKEKRAFRYEPLS